jgi:hypothetical protein
MRIWKASLCAAAMMFGLSGGFDHAQAQTFPEP